MFSSFILCVVLRANYRNHWGLGTYRGLGTAVRKKNEFRVIYSIIAQTGTVDSALGGDADMCGEVWRYATPDSRSGNSGYRVSSNRVLHYRCGTWHRDIFHMQLWCVVSLFFSFFLLFESSKIAIHSQLQRILRSPTEPNDVKNTPNDHYELPRPTTSAG